MRQLIYTVSRHGVGQVARRALKRSRFSPRDLRVTDSWLQDM